MLVKSLGTKELFVSINRFYQTGRIYVYILVIVISILCPKIPLFLLFIYDQILKNAIYKFNQLYIIQPAATQSYCETCILAHWNSFSFFVECAVDRRDEHIVYFFF